ncbi:MAG TPA: ABC transporter ATP-binding protein [Candidatus Dormibacteraeota bacterium]|nr:ABC transporter ATP-binding protein [Candidatus Dormibacteraeota bacterium]
MLAPAGAAILDVQGVTAGYGGAPIISDVSLRAARGKLTALVGPNGAGKSTFIKVIAGLITPDSGRVMLEDKDVTGVPAQLLVRRGISYVPQVANVFPTLTVLENLEMGAYTRRHGVREKIDELCGMFPDLRPALKRQARTLSGGQRTMLAIARGLMLDPQVLLLDEPTAGLAPKFIDKVWEQVLTVRQLDVAVLIVEQNTRRTLTHADWAYVMVLGRNALGGTGEQLLDDPEVVNLYIGKEV